MMVEIQQAGQKRPASQDRGHRATNGAVARTIEMSTPYSPEKHLIGRRSLPRSPQHSAWG